MEETVKYLYYINKMLQKDIANELDISRATVSRIIRKDPRYIEEKNNRKRLNRIKHNKDIQRRVEEKRKNTSDLDYQIMKKMHEEASLELSGGKKPIGDIAFRNWNKSAYRYDSKNNRYVLKKEINAGVDVPKTIKWNRY